MSRAVALRLLDAAWELLAAGHLDLAAAQADRAWGLAEVLPGLAGRRGEPDPRLRAAVQRDRELAAPARGRAARELRAALERDLRRLDAALRPGLWGRPRAWGGLAALGAAVLLGWAFWPGHPPRPAPLRRCPRPPPCRRRCSAPWTPWPSAARWARTGAPRTTWCSPTPPSWTSVGSATLSPSS